jgi:hypothetical protein
VSASTHEVEHGERLVADDLDEPRREALRRGIIQYLRLHPLAGDTPEGIVSHWLPATGYEDASELIEEVAALMVAAGELAARALPDGGVLYVRGPALRPLS